MKIVFLRLAGLAVIAAAGWVAFALAVHAMILLGLTAGEADGSFGSTLATRTALIWMGTIILGIIGVFIKESWRYVLYFSPFYAPPLFVVFHTLAI